MSNKDALRALQTRLAERMQQVRHEAPGVSWLAVDCAGCGLLFPLREAGEIFDAAVLMAVPHTRAWFAGVTNLRGGICTVIDLAVFLGLRDGLAAPPATGGRLVAFNAALGVNAALRVDRLEGLRHAAEMQPAARDTDDPAAPDNAPRPGFAPACWRDADGRLWQEISLAELARHGQFLAIAD